MPRQKDPFSDPYAGMTPVQATRARALDDLQEAEKAVADLDRELQLARDRVQSLLAARPAAVERVRELRQTVRGMVGD